MATATQNRTSNQDQSDTLGSFKNAIGNNQVASKATQFAKDRPWATAALAGVVGVALLNTLRGKGLPKRS